MVGETIADKQEVCGQKANDVFEALANRHRRRLLLALSDEHPSAVGTFDPLELVGEVDDSDATQIELVHVHLPKLSKQGFIDWNRETGEISPGAEWGTIVPVIDLIQEYQSEFPTGLL